MDFRPTKPRELPLIFGVSADHSRRGYGGIALSHAMDTARAVGARYLRLFVVDRNLPAIRLYEKSGFVRRNGFYDEVIDDEVMLREYGYEIAL